MRRGFWERRKFFDNYGVTHSQQSAGAPYCGVRFTCPCCGYPTLGGRATCEICHLCSWEDDGQDNAHADEVWGGPNHGYSLVEARLNFENFLVKYAPEEDSRFGGADTEREKQLKRTMIAAFDGMMSDPSPEDLDSLWQIVKESEQSLYQELKRRVSGPLFEFTPCPYCGYGLRTSRAKQCRKCKMDWHDTRGVKMLGDD